MSHIISKLLWVVVRGVVKAVIFVAKLVVGKKRDRY